MNRFNKRLLTIILSVLFCTDYGFTQESSLQSDPIASEAHEFRLPSFGLLRRKETEEKEPSSLRESLKDMPAFIRDSTVKLNVRSMYFNRQDAADAPGNDKEKVSWAMGGSALLKTGKLYDVFSVNAEVFTSQKLYGPEDKDGALLLEPGQDGYTVLGALNPQFSHEGNILSLYRQRHDLPYINSQDNRMTPNTFESYVYGFLGKGDAPPFQMGIGYFDKIKRRNDDEFVSMSEAAGVSDHDRGIPWLGARIRPNQNTKIALVNYSGIDFLNIFYSDIEHSEKLSDNWSYKSSLQFSEQRSIGDDLLTNESVSAVMWGTQHALSYRKFMIRTAVTVNDDGMQLRSPFGTYPGYNSSIVEDFNQAGQVAWKAGFSYDFSEALLEGLTAYTDYIKGNNASNDDGTAQQDKEEIDINIDYRPTKGVLKNFWLRARSGFVHQDTVGTTTDMRFILNYDVPII